MGEGSRSRPTALEIPHVLFWPGILACGVLIASLLITRTEQLQGQIADVPAAALLLLALVAGTVLGNWSRTERLAEILIRPRSLVLIAVVSFVLLALGTLLVFGTSPVSSDEQAHLFQARLFAQFKLTGDYPPALIDRVFGTYRNDLILVSAQGRAMSVYWPGWALLMTPFVWLGAPWLLGPAMASLGIYVIGRLATLLAGVQAAAIAVLFALTSGAFVITGMSLLPAGGYLTLNMLFAWLLLRGGRRDTLLAGLVGGLTLNLNNPVPHALFALPWLIWMLAGATRRRNLVWLFVGYAPWLAVAVGWLLVTSSLTATVPGTTGSFWHDRLPLLINVPTLQVVGFRFWEFVRLWIWSAPGLLVLAALGWRRTSRGSGAWILGAAFVVTVVLYVLFPASQAFGWGARYYQSAWGALPILAGILLIRPGADVFRRIALMAALAGVILVIPVQVLYAYNTARSSQAGDAKLEALAASGGDVCFIKYADTENPTLPLQDSPSLTGRLVFLSQGPAADQAFVDQLFPKATLVKATPDGSCYARP